MGTYVHPLTGAPIPSVSQVLAQLKSSWRGEKMEAAALLGTATHALISRSLCGQYVGDADVPEGCGHAWGAFQGWAFDRDPRVVRIGDGVASEVALTTPANVPEELAYGGTLDLVVEAVVGGALRRILVDFKTRTARDGELTTPDRHAMTQLGGYAMLWDTAYPEKRLDGGMIVALGRNEPTYRETWLDWNQLELCRGEFAALRLALSAHEKRKAVNARSRQAARKGAA
jgi:hypothetical protein